MKIALVINIVILALVLLAQFKFRTFLAKRIKSIATLAVLLKSIPLIVSSYTLYHIWLNSPPPLRYFLPPHQPINYYFFTIGRRFWLPFIIALLISLVFLLLMHAIKKERRDKIFETEEPYIIAIAIAIVGHPLWLAYIPLALIIYLILSTASKGKRFSMYYLWIPIAILCLIFLPKLLGLEFVSLLQLSSQGI